ncbi:MAG: DsbA family protein [Oscillospiraceae bacterium]|jgi:predicted DsbA family dithiol-disulfide isomerase|nr:DsbA family protein [Oscillospiraceae bacterium]
MEKLQVYFDFACPYCWRAHGLLERILPEYPHIVPEWHPCEAHPRPERYGKHSDLCARVFLWAQATGAIPDGLAEKLFTLCLRSRTDTESPAELAKALAAFFPDVAVRNLLVGSAYAQEVADNNTAVWDTIEADAVPTYVWGGRILIAAENVGVTEGMLRAFFSR